jgi:hypothetical protein
MEANQTIYRPVGRVVSRHIGTDNLLVPVSGMAAGENAVFPVNETALFVWDRLCSGKTICQTAEELNAEFAVGSDEALEDCKMVVQNFIDQKLLEPVST